MDQLGSAEALVVTDGWESAVDAIVGRVGQRNSGIDARVRRDARVDSRRVGSDWKRAVSSVWNSSDAAVDHLSFDALALFWNWSGQGSDDDGENNDDLKDLGLLTFLSQLKAFHLLS